MPNNDLPHTADYKQTPACASEVPQSTTPPETEAAAEATPGLDLRGYELMERLGGGGMGDVYRAGDPALGRDLAVKVMKAELQGHAAAEQRFLREARVTGSLQHPGIVPIHNLGRLADSRLHYTMRLVRGRTFAEILREEAGKSERLPGLLAIFEKVCQAVAYAHSKQVIHRDLKPANVMVGRFGEVQVMDWGLAKLLTAEGEPERAAESAGTRIYTEGVDTPLAETRMGREMGTPAYMPPEQALGEWDTVDERADVFALGAMLCEMLTGQPPYRGSADGEALRKAKRGDLVEALTRVEGCGADAALVQLCRECLAPAREGRPRDAEQVAQRLAAYQAEVQERLRHAELERTAAMVKAREERKKRRWMLAAMLLLLAGAAVSIWQAVRALTFAAGERQAKDLAQNRLGQIEKANEVLTSIFHDLDLHAEEKGGPGLVQQLSRHLERAATQLDEGMVGDPVTLARLQATLGVSLIHLGQAKAAIELFNKAVPALETQLGPDHLDTLECRNALAEAYWSAGRLAESIRLYEQNLKHFEAKLGADHPTTLLARHGLAVAYFDAGRTAEAIPMHEQNLKQREAALGADHNLTMISRQNLANAYYVTGRTTEAVRLFEQNLKLREATLGADHTLTLNSRNAVGMVCWSTGRTAEAIRLFEQTLKQSEAKLGPEHPNTFAVRNNLANAYHSAGRIAEAVRLHEQTLKQMEVKLGVDHPKTLISCHNLANAYRAAGRTAEAIRLYEPNLKQMETKLGPAHQDTLRCRGGLANAYREAGRIVEAIHLDELNLQLCEAKFGPGHPDTLQSCSNLADGYDRAGKFAKSEVLHRAALEQTRKRFGAEDPATTGRMAQLSLNLLHQHKYADAEPLLRDCLKIRQAQQPDDWATYNTQSMLGEALSGQQKFAESEPLLVQGYEGMKQRQDKIPPVYRQQRLSEALERLVRLYKATGQKEKAADWRKKLDEAKAAQKKAKP